MKNINTKCIITMLVLIATLTNNASLQASGSAPIVVIVSNSSPITSINGRQLRRLFLGKSIKLPNGSRATLATYDPAKTEFNKVALKRTNAQVNSAWSRLKFSGRTLEPKIFDDPQGMIDFIAQTPNSIGYINKAELRGNVRAIYSLE